MYVFFFSSRRRHTRWNCDWSSDVCSSDLIVAENQGEACAQFVGLAEGFAEFLFDRRQLDAESRVAQILGGPNRVRVGLFAHPGNVNVAPCRYFALAAFLKRENQAVFADRKPDAFRGRS